MTENLSRKTLKEIVTLTDREKDPCEGQAEKAWKAAGLTPRFDPIRNELSVDVPRNQDWNDRLTHNMIEDLRERWCIDEPTLDVSYACEMGPVGRETEAVVIPMRIAASRGNTNYILVFSPSKTTYAGTGWVDIVPSKSTIIMPCPSQGHVYVKVTATLDRTNTRFTFIDGTFPLEQDKLDTLGPNTPGRMFTIGPKCVLFVHWIARSHPAFITLACNMNDCPV